MPSKFLNGNGCRLHPNHSRNSYLHQIEVSPTKRRGPIAAEFSSPGPAIVLLPSTFGPNRTDARKSISPSYTFGGRYDDKRELKTPGPGEYDIENVTRIGKDWSPTVFMSPKLKEPEPFNTPSPTQYSPEKSVYYSRGRQAPSYTFGSKVKETVPDLTPPPTAYNVPEPEAYKIQRQPMFTFRSKTELPTDKTKTPSPADYKTENVWINKTQSPNVSFGAKSSPFAHSF